MAPQPLLPGQMNEWCDPGAVSGRLPKPHTGREVPSAGLGGARALSALSLGPTQQVTRGGGPHLGQGSSGLLEVQVPEGRWRHCPLDSAPRAPSGPVSPPQPRAAAWQPELGQVWGHRSCCPMLSSSGDTRSSALTVLTVQPRQQEVPVLCAVRVSRGAEMTEDWLCHPVLLCPCICLCSSDRLLK
jgi:hypothetical protein